MPGRKLLLILVFLVSCGVNRAEIVINEIMYNSPGSPDVEYIELFNAGPETVDMTGWYLLDDDDQHDRCILVGTLKAGEYLVAAESMALFGATYPGVGGVNPNPCGSTTPGVGFSLGNTNDDVRLFDPAETLIDIVSYADTDPWPTDPDGLGPSLELLSPALDNGLAASWAASLVAQGTPGAQNSVFVADFPPVIDNLRRDIALPAVDDTVAIVADVDDDVGLVSVELSVDTGNGYVVQPMFDDGLHDDGDAGDSTFGAAIAPLPDGTVVRYFVTATDSLAQATSLPATAPAAYRAYTVGHVLPTLLINEFMASNQNGITDGAGDNDDWLEIRNTGIAPVNLEGMYLSNDAADPTLWALPFLNLSPGSSVLIWCDDETFQGPFHAGFRLGRAGGFVGIYDAIDRGNLLVDGGTYGPQVPDVSFGHFPDDSDTKEYLLASTPGFSNDPSTLYSPVCINEFLAASQVGIPDWIELYNRSAATIDISGWYISDDPDDTAQFQVPGGTLLAPGERVVYFQSELGFGFDENGSESIVLTSGDGSIGRDYLDYGPQFPDVSEGRLPDGNADWHKFSAWTLGQENGCSPGSTGYAPVTGLRYQSLIVLTWDALEGAGSYDVIGGDLMALRATGDFAAASLECAGNNVDRAELFEPSFVNPGQAAFFLVRAVDAACGFGTFDRDATLDACP